MQPGWGAEPAGWMNEMTRIACLIGLEMRVGRSSNACGPGRSNTVELSIPESEMEMHADPGLPFDDTESLNQ